MKEFLADGWAGLLLGAAAGMFSTLLIGISIANNHWQAETVQRGLAQYCPNDGAWAWKGECK